MSVNVPIAPPGQTENGTVASMTAAIAGDADDSQARP